jgi:hypothetical protein
MKAVGSGQWAVGSGQWAVGSGQLRLLLAAHVIVFFLVTDHRSLALVTNHC